MLVSRAVGIGVFYNPGVVCFLMTGINVCLRSLFIDKIRALDDGYRIIKESE